MHTNMTSWWRHNEIISPQISVFLEFSSYVFAEGQHFSSRQRWHFLDLLLYGLLFRRMVQLISKSMFLSFRFQTCLLSSVEYVPPMVPLCDKRRISIAYWTLKTKLQKWKHEKNVFIKPVFNISVWKLNIHIPSLHRPRYSLSWA